jgi:hypothetical protein
LLKFDQVSFLFSPRPRSSTSFKMSTETLVRYPKISRLNPDDVRRYVKNQMESLELLLKSIEPVDVIVPTEEKTLTVEEKVVLPQIEEKKVLPQVEEKTKEMEEILQPALVGARVVEAFAETLEKRFNDFCKKFPVQKPAEFLPISPLVETKFDAISQPNTDTTKKRKFDCDDNQSLKKIKLKMKKKAKSIKRRSIKNSLKIIPMDKINKLYSKSGYKSIALEFKKAVESGKKLKQIKIELNWYASFSLDEKGVECYCPLSFYLKPYKNDTILCKIKMAVCGICQEFCSTGRGLLRHHRNRHFDPFKQNEIDNDRTDKNLPERSPTLKLIVLE